MIRTSTGLPNKFSHKPAITLAEFAMTQNCATQAVAKADENIANTGTGEMILAGQPVLNIQDAALDISADTQFGVWATAQSYTSVDFKYVTDDNGYKQWYKCIASNTSAAANKPGSGANWRTYWVESTNRAEQAEGQTCGNGYTRHYLVLCNSAGTMTTVIADKGLQLDANQELQIPQFDPEYFVALAVITVDGTGASTWGTTDDNGQCTVRQLLGPVFPHKDKLDRN